MEIVKLSDRRDTRGSHLAKRLQAKSVESIRIDFLDEAVHGFPPRPEAPGTFRERFPFAAKSTLKCVRVRVHESGKQRVMGETLCRFEPQRTDVHDLAPFVDRDLYVGFERLTCPSPVALKYLLRTHCVVIPVTDNALR